MKWLSLVLAILLLTLSCIPCSDGLALGQEQQLQPLHRIAGHPDAAAHSDTCSPLCQCACCVVAFTLPAPALPVALWLLPEQDILFPLHHDRFPNDIMLSIWQPPRLS